MENSFEKMWQDSLSIKSQNLDLTVFNTFPEYNLIGPEGSVFYNEMILINKKHASLQILNIYQLTLY